MNMSSIEPYIFLIISSQFEMYLVLQSLQANNLCFVVLYGMLLLQ